MALSQSQIKELLKKPLNRAVIQKATKHEERLRFHVDTNMESSDASFVLREFTSWVQQLIPDDKYKIFLQLLKFPIPTNELTEEIFSSLEKVFDGRDAHEDYFFISPELTIEGQDYLSSIEPKWREKAFEIFKTKINSIVIVDTNVDQNTERPEPYTYTLNINQVQDLSYDNDGVIEWIIFPQPDNRLAVFDDAQYRVFQLNDNKEIIGIIIEESHDLGYCPASFFWSDVLKNSQQGIKKSPVSNQLSNLDWSLFFQISKRHLDLYAPYPIYSGYESDCDYSDEESGEYCDNGFIKNSDDAYLRQGTGLMPCPVCSTKRIAGVGSFIDVPLPSDDNGNLDLRNPIQITTIDKDSLEYNVNENDRIVKSIFSSVVGYGGEMTLSKAFNEDQVKANTESRRNVLISLKKNFEKIKGWTADTIFKLRYGANYLGSEINLGSDFYFYSGEELNKIYKEAKESGATDVQLDDIQDQIIETENKGNSKALARAKTLKHLEPYRHQTRKEVIENRDNNLGNEDLIVIKLNFSNFVMRFERENTDIVEFGSALNFDKKIEIILNRFKEYGKSEIRGSEKS